ncbi:tetratricopeptide repeat protein [Nitrosopumilus ureiphilus]|uniref:Uncharacterized protein n=1 Tax=Nitrosopumilus ureiphilus TaxID=1470067 RepID=A0A7D5M4G7_9ARCH|nr:hypothetical protein [Nitrosopumilus ureiphilus]QLH06926.1 hypothetical protein C5F50_07460 [Nitrosopumilus ureiphilus]
MFFLLLIPTGYIFAQSEPSLEELLQQVKEFEEQEKYYSGLLKIEEIIDKYPKNVDAKSMKCLFQLNANLPLNEVKSCLDNLPSEVSGDLLVLLTLGSYHAKNNDLEKSKYAFWEAFTLYPKSEKAESRYVTIQLALDPNNEELFQKLQVLYEKNNDFQILENVIALHNEREEYDKSQKLLDIGFKVDANNPNLLTHQGVLYAKQGELKKAEEFFVRAVNEEPDNIQSLLNQGLLYLELGDKENNLEYYKKSRDSYRNVLEIESDNLFGKTTVNYLDQKIGEIQSFLVFVGLSILLIAVIGIVSLTLYISYNNYRKDQDDEETEPDPTKKEKLGKRIIHSKIFMVSYTGFFVISLTLLIVPLLANEMSVWDGNDMANWSTMIVEIGIGIIIVGLVWIFDDSRNKKFSKQQKEISKQTKEIDKQTKNIEGIASETSNTLTQIKEERLKQENYTLLSLRFQIDRLQKLFPDIEKFVAIYNDPNKTTMEEPYVEDLSKEVGYSALISQAESYKELLVETIERNINLSIGFLDPQLRDEILELCVILKQRSVFSNPEKAIIPLHTKKAIEKIDEILKKLDLKK